jgi:putative addiction module component (TIGR02574 family)
MLEGLADMSVSDRLHMIRVIWESLEKTHQTLPLTETQSEELDRRLEAHKANPGDIVPWDEVRAGILRKK